MPAKEWTPAEIAEYDQVMAAADQQLDLTLQAVRAVRAESGTYQGMAAAAGAVLTMHPTIVTNVLVAALRRLTEPENPDAH